MEMEEDETCMAQIESVDGEDAEEETVEEGGHKPVVPISTHPKRHNMQSTTLELSLCS